MKQWVVLPSSMPCLFLLAHLAHASVTSVTTRFQRPSFSTGSGASRKCWQGWKSHVVPWSHHRADSGWRGRRKKRRKKNSNPVATWTGFSTHENTTTDAAVKVWTRCGEQLSLRGLIPDVRKHILRLNMKTMLLTCNYALGGKVSLTKEQTTGRWQRRGGGADVSWSLAEVAPQHCWYSAPSTPSTPSTPPYLSRPTLCLGLCMNHLAPRCLSVKCMS